MLKIEINLLSNNVVLPFQQLTKNFQLEFLKLNKIFASQLIAEHGLGFLINIYEDDNSEKKHIMKLIFDTGGPNLTFLHNLDVFNYPLYDLDLIILSHWHNDHTGSLYKILERVNKKIQIITHESASFERFFIKSKEISHEDLRNKKREELEPLFISSKIEIQEKIDLEKIKNLNGDVVFKRKLDKIQISDSINLYISGEIPRRVKFEDFDYYSSLQNNISKIDKILDDKCLIFEIDDHLVILTGCCHSGLINTLNYVKEIIKKPISHIIGGFHMANESEFRIKETLEYLKSLEKYNNNLYLFPIHCSGEEFIKIVNNINNPEIKAFNCSVGTIFYF
jgi:7,8-dihydropterin-6-yl-methyl-4-(beta-D-ribofuranosyl)aminobenzene 5'-phosphate synthase